MKRRQKINFTTLASKYGVCERTARRWHSALGNKIHDPRAIAEMILRQRNPKPEVIATIHSLITSP